MIPSAALIVALALAAETAATPPPVEAPQVAPAAAAAAPPEKQICRRGMNQTGSRMKVRPVCMTKREWEERARHDKETMSAIQRGSTSNTGTPGTAQ